MRLATSAALLLACAATPAAAQQLAYAIEEREDSPAGAEGPRLHYALLDRLEYASQRGEDGYAWDFSALYGGDTNRLWLSIVGEGPTWGDPDYVEVQALYGRDAGGGWDVNAGLRYDVVPRPRRLYLTVGGQLTKEWTDSDFWLGAFTYVSHEGELSARVGGIYNRRLSGRFFLQPSLELNASAQDVPELTLGRGLTYAELGLRLRYQLRDAFAPYAGISWERSLGRTARMERAEGDDPETTSLVLGVRSDF